MPDEKDILRAKMHKAELTIRTPEIRIMDQAILDIESAVYALLNIITKKYQYTVAKMSAAEKEKKLVQFYQADFAESSRFVQSSLKRLEVALNDIGHLQNTEARLKKKLQNKHEMRLGEQKKVLTDVKVALTKINKDLEAATKQTKNFESSAKSFKSSLLEQSATLGIERAKRTALIYLSTREFSQRKFKLW